MPRVEEPGDRRSSGEPLLHRRGRVRRIRSTSSSRPQPIRNSAWLRLTETVEAGSPRAALERGQVDVGGQVLTADRDERVGVGALAGIGAQRAAGRGRA